MTTAPSSATSCVTDLETSGGKAYKISLWSKHAGEPNTVARLGVIHWDAAGWVRIISAVDHNHWNGWARTSSGGGSQSLEMGVSITGIHRLNRLFCEKRD